MIWVHRDSEGVSLDIRVPYRHVDLYLGQHGYWCFTLTGMPLEDAVKLLQQLQSVLTGVIDAGEKETGEG